MITNCSGQVPSGATVHTLGAGVGWDEAAYQLHVGDFDGNGRADIYMQAAVGGTNRVAFTDSNGNVTSTPVVHEPSGFPSEPTTYEYDALGRVSKVTYADGSYVDYSFDAAGNRTSVTGTQN